MSIQYLDRESKKIEEEKIYGGYFLAFLYKNSLISKIILHFVVKLPLVSWIYGILQKAPWSKKKIAPFIKKFHIDASEFSKTVDSFSSFNDFFIRKLKPDARPIAKEACLPADGRYLVIESLSLSSSFLVKGVSFNLERFLGSKEMAKQYEGGTLILARLCPIDYHRFHFPIDCIPSKPFRIPGPLYSVNPIATKKFPDIFWTNKREIVSLKSDVYGAAACVLVGATNVGTIHYSYTPEVAYSRGDEMGYFSFGGSSMVLLFQKGKIKLADDIVRASADGIEARGKMGQSLLF